MNRRRLIVVLEEQIFVYDISNMKLLHTIDTSINPGGNHGQRVSFDLVSNIKFIISCMCVIAVERQLLHCVSIAVFLHCFFRSRSGGVAVMLPHWRRGNLRRLIFTTREYRTSSQKSCQLRRDEFGRNTLSYR